MDEIDIRRAAGLMIELYGSSAAVSATARGKRAFEYGSAEGFHTWKRVVDAINDIEHKKSEFRARATLNASPDIIGFLCKSLQINDKC